MSTKPKTFNQSFEEILAARDKPKVRADDTRRLRQAKWRAKKRAQRLNLQRGVG